MGVDDEYDIDEIENMTTKKTEREVATTNGCMQKWSTKPKKEEKERG